MFAAITTLVLRVTLWVRERARPLRERPEAGYSTETIIWTAVLALLAIAAAGIIYTKVIAKANSIDLG